MNKNNPNFRQYSFKFRYKDADGQWIYDEFSSGTVSRFTGFVDIRGKDVYEGDTVFDRTYYDDLWPWDGYCDEHYVHIGYIVVWCYEKGSWALEPIIDEEEEGQLFWEWSLEGKKLEVTC